MAIWRAGCGCRKEIPACCKRRKDGSAFSVSLLLCPTKWGIISLHRNSRLILSLPSRDFTILPLKVATKTSILSILTEHPSTARAPFTKEHDCKPLQSRINLISIVLILTSCLQQRRQNRQRRDYLYRRALLLRDAEISEKRAKLREALATGKPLDRSIANDEQLRKDFQYDETQPEVNEQLDLDDECRLQILGSFFATATDSLGLFPY